MPKVSVIIPTYNKAKSIEVSLSSVLSQTLDDIEIIVVDDASTDNTLEILEQYKDRITIIKNEKNLGAGTSRNKGLDIAKGEYIGFIDSDDIVEDTYFECMYNAGIKTDADVILGNIEFIESYDEMNFWNFQDNDNSEHFSLGFEVVPEIKNPVEAFKTGRSANTKLYKKDLLTDLRFLSIRDSEDYAFSKIACFHAKKIVKTKARYFYLFHEESIKKDLSYLKSYILDMFAVTEAIEENVKSDCTNKRYKRLSQQRFIISHILRILELDIEEEAKEKITYYLLKRANEKYGDWKETIKYLVFPNAGLMVNNLISIEERLKTLELSEQELNELLTRTLKKGESQCH